MSGTAGTWNSALPGATNAERLTYYAELMAAQMEAFRTERAYVGLLFFCGLGSSFPSAQGVTSDILSPDVSTAESLEIRPYTKELLRNAFADLGIVIDEYTEDVKRGDKLRLPIVLVNDTGKAVTDLPVTIKIMNGDTVLYAERIIMSVDAFSKDNKGLARETITVTVPAFRDYCKNRQVLTVTASYELNGETVYSQRKWTIQGGDFTDDPLPTYDWLGQEEETETDETVTTAEPDTQVTPGESSDETVGVATRPSVTTGEADTKPAKGGCGSAVSGAALATLALVGGGIAATQKKRKSKEKDGE